MISALDYVFDMTESVCMWSAQTNGDSHTSRGRHGEQCNVEMRQKNRIELGAANCTVVVWSNLRCTVWSNLSVILNSVASAGKVCEDLAFSHVKQNYVTTKYFIFNFHAHTQVKLPNAFHDG